MHKTNLSKYSCFLKDNLLQRDYNVIARPTTRIPLVVAEAKKDIIIDSDGKQFIDFTSGWNVANTGWNHSHINKAVSRQAKNLTFSPPWCSHEGRIRVAERINSFLPGDFRALCVVSGSEAVEAALKVARRATGRHVTIGFTEAYHGGTLGAMLAGGVKEFKRVYLPEDAIHKHAPIPDLLRSNNINYAETIYNMILKDPKPAAVLLEPIFTNPGVLYGPLEFYKTIEKACKLAGSVLIIDEVGTGFGRTGKMFGFEHWGILPDIICIAKALTSGAVPMAAAIIKSDLADVIKGPGFSSTFGWTPLACTAANATLDVIENENLIERSREFGYMALDILKDLRHNKYVADIRGKGLEIGIELTTLDKNPIERTLLEKLITNIRERGVFIEPSSYTSTLLVMPPLIIEESKFRKALSIIIEEIGAFNFNG